MNIENAKQEFMKYVEKYDLENKKIKRKIGHSLRVMDNAKNIASSLDLSKEEIEIASLIGLLHDIGRFEQEKRCYEFNDSLGIDHGDLGVEILQENNYIRKYIEENEYDNVILKAIKNHNKFKIEEGLTEQELLFSKIIRDADKLDIFYEGAEMFWNTKEERKEIGASTITVENLEEFKNFSATNREKNITPADGLLNFISFIFDINYDYTLHLIREKKYIDKIFDKFQFENETTEKQMKSVREITITYINKKD